MTKEELAKKKKLKGIDAPQTAAESLILSKPVSSEENKVPKKEKKPSNGKEEKAESKIAPKEQEAHVKEIKKAEEPALKNESTETPRAGRPKGRPAVKVTVNVPEEDMELLNIAASIVFKGNVSSYIVSLIEKDIAANDIYKKILEMTK